MPTETLVYKADQIFTGDALLGEHCAVFKDGIWIETVGLSDVPEQLPIVDLGESILSPGYTDLQVNGGGGLLFNDDPSLESLATIARAHRLLGTTKFLPTLISDSREKTVAAIEACKSAIDSGIAGIAGLHLEGPHLSVTKKGAHDERFIRPMESTDLDLLLQASVDLAVLKITIAPENVSLHQVRALSDAGVVISLGHTDASFDTCVEYLQAGAQCVTHLYNAMSQLGSREPGLVGAALESRHCTIGLIADGNHVHPASIRAAWHAKPVADHFYLVSDAMAPAGTNMSSFTLNGRLIHRKQGRLTLSDNTLAGADLDLTTAIRFMHKQVGLKLLPVLRAATTVPDSLLGRNNASDTAPYTLRDVIRISADLKTVTPLA